MKIMQIENGFVHWDATRDVPDLNWAKEHYASNIVFVEAPDYVFEGWSFDETLEGDARFVVPTAPEGWHYDIDLGTFVQDGYEPPPKPPSAIENAILDAINMV